MADVEIVENNKDAIINALTQAVEVALTQIGIKAEKYAKDRFERIKKFGL